MPSSERAEQPTSGPGAATIQPASTQTLEVDTPVGIARVHLRRTTSAPRGVMVLGHGAGGGIEAVDLQRVSQAVHDIGWDVALLEQPWRVAGRRVAAPPPKLDQAFVAVIEQLRTDPRWAALPMVLGGRSAGARVACRLAVRLGAAGVLALAFPLHPPGRPERSRAEELTGTAGVPVLVVQGLRDAFGTPNDVRAALADEVMASVQVVAVAGDHGLKSEPEVIAEAVTSWLEAHLPGKPVSSLA